MNLHQLNDTGKKIPVFMADANSPTDGKTGLTVSVRISKNGGAFAAAAGTVAELEGGHYVFTPAAGDVDTLGPLVIRATATGGCDFGANYRIVAYNPYSAASLGLTNLDTTVSSRLAAADYTAPLTAAGVRTAVGLASANLDTQLSTIAGYIDTEVAAILTDVIALLARTDPATDLSAIKAVTDKLAAMIQSNGGGDYQFDAVALELAPTGGSVTLSAEEREEIANTIFDLIDSIEVNFGFREAMRIILASAAGKLSGAATTSVHIRDVNDTKDRILATVDADGNRTAVTLDGS